MNRQLRLRDGKIKTAYWSLVGVVAALLVSTQAVFAADKVPVIIKASKEEQEMITTDRAELEAILKERQQEAD